MSRITREAVVEGEGEGEDEGVATPPAGLMRALLQLVDSQKYIELDR